MELEKMKLTSASGSELNLEALYQIMPSAFTEVRDEKTGKITPKINFSTLRELLGDNAYDEADEEYGFKWVGKNAARREAARSINKTLRPCPEESVDWENTQNLYIEGDNLEVLKLLQKSYLGKIKMIYIDPPYNTGNDFVYRDDFAMDKYGYDRAAGDVDELGTRFRRNTDGNGRFHSDWCSMIYSRLMVAHSLLKGNGVIFISIDENEERNLKNICDEVFGERNKVGTVIWERAFAPKNDAKYFSDSHDYILVYAKNLESFEIGLLPRTEEANARYKNPDNDPKGPWTPDNMTVKTYSATYDYPITTPSGTIMTPPNGRCWFTSKERMNQLITEGRVWFGEHGGNMPRLKRYLSDVQQGMTSVTIWKYTEVGHNQEGRQELKKVFDNKGYFDGPKPLRLMKRILQIANLEKDSIILDFFSGSATTAHAVMQLNAEDGGNRRYIMVQLPEETEAGSEAYKAGYKNICEIGKERIRHAGRKIKEEAGEKAAALDTGFRVFKCEDSFMNDVYFSPAELQQQDLFAQIYNIKDGTSDLSMLFGCMLDWGVQLSLPLSTFEVAGKTIYNVNDGDLVACFNENVNEDAISAIAELNPLRVVFRDSCFGDAPLKMNLFELFKQKCGWSEEVVKSRVHVI